MSKKHRRGVRFSMAKKAHHAKGIRKATVRARKMLHDLLRSYNG